MGIDNSHKTSVDCESNKESADAGKKKQMQKQTRNEQKHKDSSPPIPLNFHVVLNEQKKKNVSCHIQIENNG